jgi:CheY-like chemotaxis protein
VATKRKTAPVLIVDEDDEARSQLAGLLEHAGLEVIEATTGEEAIRIVREQDVALALLEVALDDVSGYEVCRTIREEVGHDPGVMFISGNRTESYDRVAGLIIGADDYVAKPYAADELLARVRALLRHNLRTTAATRAGPHRSGARGAHAARRGSDPGRACRTPLHQQPNRGHAHPEHLPQAARPDARAGGRVRVPRRPRRASVVTGRFGGGRLVHCCTQSSIGKRIET